MDYRGRIIALSVLATRFNQGENIFRSYTPIIESVLEKHHKKGLISVVQIQDVVERELMTTIPIPTIRTLLGYLRAENKVMPKDHGYYKVIVDRIKKTDYKEYEQKEEIDNLILDFVRYCNSNNIDISDNEAKKQICIFLCSNSKELNKFFQPNYSIDTECFLNSDITKTLVNFINTEKNNNSTNYNTLKSLYVGAMLSSLFEIKNLHAVAQKRSFNIKEVILDSNFVFRLLDLQTELETRIARSTYDYLIEYKIKIKVLDITIDEIKSALNRYGNFRRNIKKRYWNAFALENKLGGFTSASARRNLSPAYFLQLSKDIEDVIQNDWDIKVAPSNIIDSKIKSDDIDQLFERKKKPYSNFERLRIRVIHDLKLIKYIEVLRKDRVRDFVSCKTLLLTNDLKLSSWNTKDHASYESIPECITEQQFNNLLWLYNPVISESGLSDLILILRNKDRMSDEFFKKLSENISKYEKKYSNDEQRIILLYNSLPSKIDLIIEENDYLEEQDKFEHLIEETIEAERRDKIDKDVELEQYKEEVKALKQAEKRSYSAIKKSKEETLEQIESNIRSLNRESKKCKKTMDNTKSGLLILLILSLIIVLGSIAVICFFDDLIWKVVSILAIVINMAIFLSNSISEAIDQKEISVKGIFNSILDKNYKKFLKRNGYEYDPVELLEEMKKKKNSVIREIEGLDEEIDLLDEENEDDDE